jgi:hypothetical protein
MRLFDYTAHINEDGKPVLVLTIEVPLSIDLFDVPDELRHAIDKLIKKGTVEKRND